MDDTGWAPRVLPRPGMLRRITDRAVLDQVMVRGQVTRAELSEATGISKPTISESARRLQAAGVLCETGSQSGRRGRVATYYSLSPGAGWALALDLDQDGVHTLSADLSGAAFDQHDHPPVEIGDTAGMVASIRSAVRRALRMGRAQHGPLRAVGLSVANAVDPASQEILALPNTPFPEGLLNPADIFSRLGDVPLIVDNDINCAARAEHRIGAARGVENFAYVFIGAGLGLGLYVGNRLVRGAHGLAGEIGYLATATGPAQYSTLVSALSRQGFSLPGTPVIDVPTILAALEAAQHGDAVAGETALAIGAAVGQVIIDTCAVVDPELVLLGGPLGIHRALLPAARDTVQAISPAPVRIELAALGETVSLQGALFVALDRSRDDLIAAIA
jgi:predicted NBD/HSP70 family sugar kinase